MINSPLTVFVSAWQEGSDMFANLKRQALLGEVLRNYGYTYDVVAGRYGSDSEQSFAVPIHTVIQAENIARHVGAIYNQQCIGLLEHETGEFRLVYPSGKQETIGKFTEVSEQAALKEPSASFWHGIWWVAK